MENLQLLILALIFGSSICCFILGVFTGRALWKRQNIKRKW